jgi:hypothetical protein
MSADGSPRRSSVSFLSGFRAGLDTGDLNVDVDPTGRLRAAVQERAGDALLIAADDSETAGAFLHGVAVVTTRAGILANTRFC